MTVEVDALARGKPIAPTMHGIFYEDVNGAGDGGLYAELLLNRAFEFEHHLSGWMPFGKVEVFADGPFDRCPHYVRLSDVSQRDFGFLTGLENAGFPGGMYMKAQADYRVTLWARAPSGTGALQFRFDERGARPVQTVTNGVVKVTGSDWKKYVATVKMPRTTERALFRLVLNGTNDVDVAFTSVMPVDTWRGRENGLRKDLAQALADLKPGIFRFPGGCIVEGRSLAGRFDWKRSVGPVENRPPTRNIWGVLVRESLNPEYHMSYGLGFYELFQFAEDVGAAPMPVVNCGLHCQFGAKDQHGSDDLAYLDAYIQDAFDLVEFANGAPTTKWGRVRTEMGHPAPFGLAYLGIGNEQWDEKDDPIYTVRLKKFVDAFRKRHPEIRLVACGVLSIGNPKWNYVRERLWALDIDFLDEHKYGNAEWFKGCGTVYDGVPRNGKKYFVTEYAEIDTGGWGQFNRSMSGVWEAAFLTMLERNCDLVEATAYAPDFVNKDAWNWAPGLIWFDKKGWDVTSSYLTQKLFADFRGIVEIPATAGGRPVTGANGFFASAAKDKEGRLLVRLVNVLDEPLALELCFRGNSFPSGRLVWAGYSADKADVEKVSSFQGEKPLADGKGSIALAPRTVLFVRLQGSVQTSFDMKP